MSWLTVVVLELKIFKAITSRTIKYQAPPRDNIAPMTPPPPHLKILPPISPLPSPKLHREASIGKQKLKDMVDHAQGKKKSSSLLVDMLEKSGSFNGEAEVHVEDGEGGSEIGRGMSEEGW